jgi:hypothetical protein
MINPKDGAEGWLPNEPPPSNFDPKPWQKKCDDIVGTRDGKSLIKLAWAPQEFRWWPIRVGQEDVKGYTFPIFHAFTTLEGDLVAAPRWVLLERIMPAQYAPTEQFWEAKRYGYDDGVLWDFTGPLPSEKYVELRCHAYHDGVCCACIGTTCECGMEYAHCWGRYAEPDEGLLNWVRQKNWESLHDSDVRPDMDIRDFAAPNAQNDLKSILIRNQEQQKEDRRKYGEYMLDHWDRKPHSTSPSGIILTDSIN